MGFSLSIGQLVPPTIDEDGELGLPNCELVLHDQLPKYGEPTDQENQRWPSYISWTIVCKEIGINEIMFGKNRHNPTFLAPNGKRRDALINEHPGVCHLTEDHYQALKEKIDYYTLKHPNHVAGYKEDHEDEASAVVYDGNLVRAEWLLYWIRWALDNCSEPIFVNS